MSNCCPSITIPLLIIAIITNFILTNTLHPISIIIICIIYNVTLAIYITLWKALPIFPIIFILIIIRGLLIIFIYFARTISNTESSRHFNYKETFILITLWITSIIHLHIYSKAFNTSNINNSNLIDSTSNFIRIIFKAPLSSITLIRIIYLLLSLIAIIKICSPKIKTLRKLS